MKYQTLFELVMERNYIIFRASDYPNAIAMPTDGYAVSYEGDPYIVRLDHVPQVLGHLFDSLLGMVLDEAQSLGVEYIEVKVTDRGIEVECAQVFKDPRYAMGYAHGVRVKSIRDLFNDRTMPRKER